VAAVIGTRLVKTSGTLLLVGGLGLAVMNVVTALAFPGDTAAQAKEALWTPAFALVAVATMLLLFGSPMLYSLIAGPGGPMAQVGLILVAIVGMALGVFGNLQQALVLPWVASQAPSILSSSAPTPAAFTVFYIVSGVVEVLGLLALMVPLLRGRLGPRWPGGALAVAAVLGILGFVVSPGSSMSGNVGLSLLSAAPAVLLGIFFIEMGRQMLAGPAAGWRAVSADPAPSLAHR
jgi:hypothetical protein